jgi:DNA oxidative demethylase
LRPARLGVGREGLPLPDGRTLEAWGLLAPDAPPPEACLISFYDAKARIGLHQDRDEQELSAPVLSCRSAIRLSSVSAGRSDPTQSFWLKSGDALTLGGPARLAFHWVERIAAGATLFQQDGRINLTPRRTIS